MKKIHRNKEKSRRPLIYRTNCFCTNSILFFMKCYSGTFNQTELLIIVKGYGYELFYVLNVCYVWLSGSWWFMSYVCQLSSASVSPFFSLFSPNYTLSLTCVHFCSLLLHYSLIGLKFRSFVFVTIRLKIFSFLCWFFMDRFRLVIISV